MTLVVRLSLPIERKPDSSGAPTAVSTSAILDRVVHDACGKQIAFLGESPLHAFGKTLEFKVKVVRRLVEECHYRAFFIESGVYDFLHLQKALNSGATVTDTMIAAAIGGLWANREVEQLIPFLREKAQTGTLVLGGLDNQLGRGTYAQHQMPADLAEYLGEADKARCRAVLEKHMLWQYSDETPYGPKDKALILGCLDQIGAALSRGRHRPGREYDVAMIENLHELIARDFSSDTLSGADRAAEQFNDRDRQMYRNFQWLKARLPSRSKIIVWTATNHAAKDLSVVPGQEKWRSLGSYVAREFTGQGFVLGFSAYSGSYAMGRQPQRPLTPAPANSLEGRAFGEDTSDARYLDASELRKLKAVPSRLVGSGFKTASWADVVDGIVVFREEHPPH